MPEMSITNDSSYGPNPFPIRQGGSLTYNLGIAFSGTPPTSIDYTIKTKDAAGNVVKTVTGTKDTGGQSQVRLDMAVPATADGGGALPFGNYSNHVEASAPGYDPLEQRYCTGRPVTPEPCECCQVKV
jgi:hypothetical protein